jgi:alpha-L-arabinofuranosidase
MRRWLLLRVLATSLFGQWQATIQIDANKVVHPIPRTIFGAFLEPMRAGVQGGIWAELLDNPSLEANLWSAAAITHMIQGRPELSRSSSIGLPLPWESLYPQQGSRFELRTGDAANSSDSLLLMALPGGQTGVRQQVYLPVHRVLRYTGSLYAKPLGGAKQVEISLRRRNRPDEKLAAAEVKLAGGAWKKYEYTLELPKGSLASREPADFAVAVSNEDRVLLDQVVLFPADNVEGMNPEIVEMTKTLQLPLLRFGGNYTSNYHWRNGVGPMDKRTSMLNQAWGQPEYNQFGTDEFLRFCRLTGTQPQFCVNMGSGTVEEAVEWVRYVNSRWGDKKGGLWWELGNELWGNFQIGYPGLERIAERTREFSDAIRKADPRAKLIGTGADPDRFEKWNAAQLGLGRETFENLSTHLVLNAGAVSRRNPAPEFVAEATFAIPAGLERLFGEMKKQIDADPRTKGRPGLALTEWVLRMPFAPSPPDLPVERVPDYRNLGGAIWAAGMLNTLMRVSDFVPIANMTSLVEYGRVWEKRAITYGPVSYWVFRMYSNAEAAKLLDTKVDVARYDVHEGAVRVPEISGVSYLDVVGTAGGAGQKVTLFAVNRNVSHDITATVRLAGFEARSASGRILTAPDIYAGNDDAHPQAVAPRELALSIEGSEFTQVFPKASVTVIELRKR